MLEDLTALLPTATEPGQPGTLLGAVAELIEGGAAWANPPAARPTLVSAKAMTWWASLKPQVAASAACLARPEGRVNPNPYLPRS
ncbi:MAG TPA: hypothetical protein VI452_07285 [Marmoricola sp.]